MRSAPIIACLALTLSQTRAESLSAADREALIESLEALRESANSKIDARFRMAISAYREAMTSNDAVMKFYLKCIEKVNFEDQQKKAGDFREWKRKEADELSDAGFRLALRYQLRWLVLTLQANSENADPTAIAGEARQIVDALFQDIATLEHQRVTLRQSVTSTVFAKAYELGEVSKADWPTSPIPVDPIYDKVLLPPLRNPARLNALQATWIKRIQQQSIHAESWSNNRGQDAKGRKNREDSDSASSKSTRAAEFATETLPELQWQMELDLFRSGDEAGASRRMVAHISKHINHRSARDWSDQFKALLAPTVEPVGTTAADSPDGA